MLTKRGRIQKVKIWAVLNLGCFQSWTNSNDFQRFTVILEQIQNGSQIHFVADGMLFGADIFPILDILVFVITKLIYLQDSLCCSLVLAVLWSSWKTILLPASPRAPPRGTLERLCHINRDSSIFISILCIGFSHILHLRFFRRGASGRLGASLGSIMGKTKTWTFFKVEDGKFTFWLGCIMNITSFEIGRNIPIDWL